MLRHKFFASWLLLLTTLSFLSCKNSTDAGSNNNFSADVSYDGSTAVHYVSDDYHVHFNRVSGNIDTLIITADKGEGDMFVQIFMELDSIHKGDYPIRNDARDMHKGVQFEHTTESGDFYGSANLATDIFSVTDLDVAKQAIKGTFHCKLFNSGGKTAEITNGSFSWNY